MKLKYEMTVMELDGDTMAIPVGGEVDFRGVLRMNGTAAEILHMLENDVTEDEMVSALEKEYDATREQLLTSVRKIVDILRDNNLLVE